MNILCRESNLNTWVSHSKSHSIHINLSRVRLILSWLFSCEFILKNWNRYIYFFLSSLSDVMSQSFKSSVFGNDFIIAIKRFGILIEFICCIFLFLLKTMTLLRRIFLNFLIGIFRVCFDFDWIINIVFARHEEVFIDT